MPLRPFTLAFRAMHLGRYGKDSEDERFYPLYIAYWDLVRGYESYQQRGTDRVPGQSGRAPSTSSRLYGSKMLMANVELRFPLLGLLGIGKGYYGAWPLEFYGFFDWGIAYASNPGYWWGGETRRPGRQALVRRAASASPCSSYGIGLQDEPLRLPHPRAELRLSRWTGRSAAGISS